MTREIWSNLTGSSVSSFTGSPRYWRAPDQVLSFAGSAAPSNIADNYASRVRALIKAPVSGDYTFWIAADDSAELWISPDSSKFGREKIALVNGWVAAQAWDKQASQKSALIRLEAGQKYFVEALHKESGGGDNLAIAWQVPGGVRALIPATALESFTADPDDADNDDLSDKWEAQYGFSLTDNVTLNPSQSPLADPDSDGYSNFEEAYYGTNPNERAGVKGCLSLDTWLNLPGGQVLDLKKSSRFLQAPDLAEFIYSAETPQNRADQYGARMRGYVIPSVSGTYTFYVAGDDATELWLSSSESQFSKQKIAFNDSWTGSRQWTKSLTQKSIPVSLRAGKKYYIEALMKESGGGDNFSIGWQKHGTTAIEVIPGTALAAHVRDSQDPDGDEMPSAWEIQHGLDPNVADGAADPDQDLVPNALEYANGTNPQIAESIPGALLQEVWANVPGARLELFTSSPRFFDEPSARALLYGSEAPSNVGDDYALRLRGYLTAPTTGAYTFWIASDDSSALYLSHTASRHEREQISVVDEVTGNRNWDMFSTQKSRTIQLIAGQRYYFEVLHKEGPGLDHLAIAWQKPGGTRELIPSAVLSSFVKTQDDLDDDDLIDTWEVANGLDPNDNGRIDPKNSAHGDLDGDGLDNLAEYKAGTRANLSDSDGDGVSDLDETRLTGTQALSADIAPFEHVVSLHGSDYIAASPGWTQDGLKAKQVDVRGWIEYTVNLPVAGVYLLNVGLSPIADAGVSPDYEIVVSVDGETIERAVINIPKDTSGHAKILSPWLEVGNHTLRVFVDNSYHFRRVTVDQLEVLAARGTDTNTNEIPDWVELRIAKYNSIEAPVNSLTSPVCLEGKAKWGKLTTIDGKAVQPAPNGRWYADVTLNATQFTSVKASLENGAIRGTWQINWSPTNLLLTPVMTIRQGDSLKLTAFTSTEGTVQESVTITLEGQTITTSADHPLVYSFTTAGSYPVEVTHSLAGNHITASAIINVVAPPILESPVCVVDAIREVEIPALPSFVTLQLDAGLDIYSAVPLLGGGTRYTLKLPTLSDLPAVTRIGTNGPILGNIPFRMMRLRTSALTGVFVGGQVDATTYDIHMPVIVDGLYPETKIDFRIFIGGLTFDDGTIFKSLTIPDSVNDSGETLLHFYKTSNFGSNCHRIDVFQGSRKISSY